MDHLVDRAKQQQQQQLLSLLLLLLLLTAIGLSPGGSD